jgi:hypothetical protein
VKTNELLNVLNHFPPQSEWDGGDVVTTPDGDRYSLQEASKHMVSGESTIAPAKLPAAEPQAGAAQAQEPPQPEV